MKLNSFGITDRGLVREKNEDALFLDRERQIFAVADGLGGLPRGAEASEMAIHLLSEIVNTHPADNGGIDFSAIYREINQRVHAEGRTGSAEIGMGTTLTTARVVGNALHIAHVGDSAIVRFRDRIYDQLTTDHTMEQEIRERLGPGEDAFIPDYFAHTLTRCIGQAEDLNADILQIEIEPGDRFLICSDGVTKVLRFPELARLAYEYEDPRRFVRDIITLGNNRGGPDNITAIALFFD